MNDRVTAAVVVRNSGAVPASSTTLRLHFEPGAGAPALVLGSAETGTLAPDESRTLSLAFTVPDVIPRRSYQVWAEVDPDASLLETNDRNNRRRARLLVTVPDLAIASLTLPSAAQAGQSVTATLRVHNRGSVLANASRTSLFVTTSPTASLDGLAPAATVDVPALSAGKEALLTTELTLPMLAPGRYHLVATADSDAVQTETSETNNRRAAAFDVVQPVLAIEALEVSPAFVQPGQAAMAGLRISNRGRVPTFPTTADVFLATTESASVSSGISVSQLAIAAIQPGGTATYTAPISVPSTDPDAYYVIAQVNTSQVLDQATLAASMAPTADATWARRSVKLRVAMPDLTITSIAVSPASVRPGATVLATGRVLNPTSYPAPATTLRVWLTADPASHPTSSGSGAVLLASSAVSALTAGAGADFAVSLTIPVEIEEGVLYVQAMVDAGAVVAESNESNNLAHTSLTIEPPLPATSGPVYYVAQTGNDSSPGSEAQPFRTVRRGVQALRAGATLYVKAGTYAESLDRFPGGTSWSAPVRIVAYPGDTVVLRPPAGAARVLHFQDSATAYISVEGLVLDADNVSYDAVKITYGSSSTSAAHHIRLLRCEIKNAVGNGILVTPGSDDNEFVELNVHHNGTNEYTHGLYITSSRNLVENSTVQENAGAGVHLFSSNTLTVNDNVVRGNWIVSNARAGSWGQGIVVSRGARNRAYNNVVVGNVLGIHVDYSAADTDVYNNTVYANAREGLLIGTGSTGADVRNNIVYANTGGNYYNRGAGTTQSHNLSGVDPRFANPAAGDYRLRADSPAVDAGMILTVVSDDFDGTPRPQHGAFDIGAFELN